ncbi:cytochrome P450 2K1-like [Betta splendens]|uniref:Cytochrome P450 2K1-like n=1 Tax=Betta splendens TaxID=158456 RepID=A0A6P7N9D2_BETSP|nr:cytochrome P450 2K1-like [Betta splendens]
MLDKLFQSFPFYLLGAAVGLLVLHLLYYRFNYTDRRREPPGPRPLPLLGNLLQVDPMKLDRNLFELSKRFGPVFTVYFGVKKVVVLAGYHTVKQALINHAEEFGNREVTPIFDDFTKGNGILFTNGDTWKEMRRFALTTLRDFGMGRRLSEEKITEEIHHLIKEFEQYDGKAFNNSRVVNYAFFNIISAIMFEKRFEYKDPVFQAMVARDHNTIQLTGSASILSLTYNLFPWLGPFLKNWRKLMKNVEDNKAEMKHIIKELKKTWNPNTCRCFVDAFLTRQQNLEVSPSTLLWSVVFLLILGLLTKSITSQNKLKEPPGPRPLPLLGNLLQIDLRRPHKSLCELSKKYGSVFTVYFGTRKVVVLAGYKAVKEALVSFPAEFGDRDITPICQDVSQGHGILFANGDSWKEMRRFALSTLRDFGMGKKLSEDKIIEECQHMIKAIQELEGKPFDTAQLVNYAICNIITAVVYGHRFDYSDPYLMDLVKRSSDMIRLSGSASVQLYNTFPWLGRWIKNRELLLKQRDRNVKEVGDSIRRLKESLSPDCCRGLVDCFLVCQKKEEDLCVTNTHYTEDNLISVVTNLFSAGTDTTSSTLRWGLLLMAKYPHIQEKVQEEVRRLIGSRQVVVADRMNLPYTDAVVHEIMRVANVVHLSVPRATSQDVTFRGYFIKKGTTVIPLLTSVLADETEWETPHTFNPGHFLNEHGKFVSREAFIPFAAGRRVCLGEGLARMDVFIFFTSLLQHFRFTPPPGVTEDELDLTPVVGFTRSPSPHQLCAVHQGGF